MPVTLACISIVTLTYGIAVRMLCSVVLLIMLMLSVHVSFTYKQHEDKHMLFLSLLIELKLKLLTSFKESIFMLSII